MRERARNLGPGARLLAFACLLALVGGSAALVGAATGQPPAASGEADAGAMGMAPLSAAQQANANGLASYAGGYSFVPAVATMPLGASRTYRFRILDAHGRAVRRFDTEGGVPIHLIVVRRDFEGYQHVHPTGHPDGTWSVPLSFARPGVYRAFADFEVEGEQIVLGRDLFVPGTFAPAALPAPSRIVSDAGYTVALAPVDLRAGEETRLRFLVSRGGMPVRSFQPYVGHRGHLVALRAGDLSYSHVHPEADGAAGEIVFHSTFATAGAYRLFMQFKHAGVVHTASFTVRVRR